jgi:hypothetical protein
MGEEQGCNPLKVFMGEEQGLKKWGVSCRIYHTKEFLLFVFYFITKL